MKVMLFSLSSLLLLFSISLFPSCSISLFVRLHLYTHSTTFVCSQLLFPSFYFGHAFCRILFQNHFSTSFAIQDYLIHNQIREWAHSCNMIRRLTLIVCSRSFLCKKITTHTHKQKPYDETLDFRCVIKINVDNLANYNWYLI